MTEPTATDLEHFAREYKRIIEEYPLYFNSVVATERLALGGAAAVVAFLYTDLPTFAAGQAKVLSGLPFAIITLAGLRCLTLYMTILVLSRHLRHLEDHLLSDPDIGMQRRLDPRTSASVRATVATTTMFWLLATAVAAYFWHAYTPPVAEFGGALQ